MLDALEDLLSHTSPWVTVLVMSLCVVVGLLGGGETGQVYLARHPRLPREDALQVLSEPERRATRGCLDPGSGQSGEQLLCFFRLVVQLSNVPFNGPILRPFHSDQGEILGDTVGDGYLG